VRIHHAVTVDQHFFGEQHEEHRRHQRAARRGLDQLQRRADGVGGGVDHARHQTIDFIQRKHHGANDHGVFQLLFGHRRVEAFAFAQGDHRLDIALADQVRIENLQPRRQLDALRAGHGFNVRRFGQQHATGDAALLTDRRRLHGERLAAFGQDDALVCRLRPLNQLIAEYRWRQAHFPRGAAALVQPLGVEMAGDEVGDDLRALAVINGDFLVQAIEQVGGVVGAGAHRQYRQTGLQRATAQVHDAWIGQGVTGQQQPGQWHAVERRKTDRKNDVVAIARGYHQHAGLEQFYGVAHGARADNDFGHAPGFIIAGIEYLCAHQVGNVAGTWGVEFGLERNAAEQAEVTAAQQRRMLLQPRGKGLHALLGFDLVEDHAEDFRIFRTAEQLRLQFHAAGEFGEHFVFRSRHQNHLGIQAFGQVQIDPRGVAGAAGRHHAFDH